MILDHRILLAMVYTWAQNKALESDLGVILAFDHGPFQGRELGACADILLRTAPLNARVKTVG